MWARTDMMRLFSKNWNDNHRQSVELCAWFARVPKQRVRNSLRKCGKIRLPSKRKFSLNKAPWHFYGRGFQYSYSKGVFSENFSQPCVWSTAFCRLSRWNETLRRYQQKYWYVNVYFNSNSLLLDLLHLLYLPHFSASLAHPPTLMSRFSFCPIILSLSSMLPKVVANFFSSPWLNQLSIFNLFFRSPVDGLLVANHTDSATSSSALTHLVPPGWNCILVLKRTFIAIVTFQKEKYTHAFARFSLRWFWTTQESSRWLSSVLRCPHAIFCLTLAPDISGPILHLRPTHTAPSSNYYCFLLSTAITMCYFMRYAHICGVLDSTTAAKEFFCWWLKPSASPMPIHFRNNSQHSSFIISAAVLAGSTGWVSW